MRTTTKLLLVTMFFLSTSCNTSEINSLSSIIKSQQEEISDLKEENSKLKNEIAILDNTTSSNNNIKMVGRWLDIRPGSGDQLILSKNLTNGKHFLTSKFESGGESKEEVRMSVEKGLTRFELMENIHVEWYIIEKDGDLSMYSQNGKFATAPCF